MDCTDMKYPDNFFDIAIDKSTIDAILCGDNAFLNVAKMMKEVQRVLKTGGQYIAISYGKPENRSFHFEREHLKFNLKQFVLYPMSAKTQEEKDEKSHYIYVCTKLEGAEEMEKLFYDKVCNLIIKE